MSSELISSERYRRALVLGASGLVGRHLVRKMLASDQWSEILLVTRRLDEKMTDTRVKQLQVDFKDLPASLSGIQVDDFFCCLGTTLRAAGSREAFYQVDHDYVVQAVEALTQQGLKQALIVSAVDASARSPVFYSRVKGEMERDVSAIGPSHIVFLRPSLLLGKRDEWRPLEFLSVQLVGRLQPLFIGVLGKWRPVRADAVAAAMVKMAEAGFEGQKAGVEWASSAQMARLA